MGWFNWSRKATDEIRAGVGALGVDLNATRIRAMSTETGRPPRAVLLDDPHPDLPVAVGLERDVPEVGRAAWGIARRLPHLTCFDFLSGLGLPREWRAARQSFTAGELLALVFDRFRAACPRPDHLTLVLPPYLSSAKVSAVANLLAKVEMPVRGSAVLPLALLATTDGRPPLTMIVDADDHALTGTLVHCEANQARLLGTTVQPRLNQRVWKDRILNALADRCVRTCRRDPRDSAAAEQTLYDQIDDALDRVRQGQKVTLNIRSTHWYQDMIQQTDDFDGYCTALVKQAVAALLELAQTGPEPPQAVWLTHDAARLPGLIAALNDNTAERTGLAVLPPDAGARAAVTLAARWVRDELPRTHLDAVILLPENSGREPRAARRESTAAPVSYRTRLDN
jgi:hypothetical protein